MILFSKQSLRTQKGKVLTLYTPGSKFYNLDKMGMEMFNVIKMFRQVEVS